MTEIDDQFIKLHNVENVNMIVEGTMTPVFIIVFNDGRVIKEKITSSDYDDIINTIKETIVENSILTIRKIKIKKLCGHTTEEKPKS